MLFSVFLIQFKRTNIFNSNKFYLCMGRGNGDDAPADYFT
jgi:hypothetical protein